MFFLHWDNDIILRNIILIEKGHLTDIAIDKHETY